MHRYCDLCLENNCCSLRILRSAFALVNNISSYISVCTYIRTRVCMHVSLFYIISFTLKIELCFCVDILTLEPAARHWAYMN